MPAAPTLSPIGHELLDDPAAPAGLVRESLHHLARSNRWFGGLAAAEAGVRRLIDARPPGPVSLLDIGTGLGDIPIALGKRFGSASRRWQNLGVDRHPAAAAAANSAGVPTVVADAFALPLPDRSVDLVMISQVAHHFSRPGAVALVREASRVARVGVIIADLRRTWWAGTGFRLGSRLLGFDPVTRADGVTSLARGFRPSELKAVVVDAGYQPTVSMHLGARIVATWSTQ